MQLNVRLKVQIVTAWGEWLGGKAQSGAQNPNQAPFSFVASIILRFIFW
jgi:hypothetical protein